MKLEIFDVGHGACALLSAHGRHVMIDCASSCEYDFYPGDMLADRGISKLDVLIVTNYDEDHVRGLPNLLNRVEVARLRRNKKVSPDTINHLKDLEPGDGIATLIDMLRGTPSVWQRRRSLMSASALTATRTLTSRTKTT
ncbi:MBL fold metallo-hydrolase [Variovorax sp. DT-64]|uniref:MBL fold metallo-hydrolase n=1 Tax=Variovorax sp. DT-64 TaxID=3396160 RepID=UPI003F1D5E1A